MMSGVPSTPLTPGRDSARQSRSSRSARSAMASARGPARSAPRAGWSAAMIISRPCSLNNETGRTRLAAASAITSGLRLRARRMARYRSSRKDDPLGEDVVAHTYCAEDLLSRVCTNLLTT